MTIFWGIVKKWKCMAKNKYIIYICRFCIAQGFFPVFWEHDPYPWNWEFHRRFVKNWEKNLTESLQ